MIVSLLSIIVVLLFFFLSMLSQIRDFLKDVNFQLSVIEQANREASSSTSKQLGSITDTLSSIELIARDSCDVAQANDRHRTRRLPFEE
jgi:methyl-accepting chemotaxis protein